MATSIGRRRVSALATGVVSAVLLSAGGALVSAAPASAAADSWVMVYPSPDGTEVRIADGDGANARVVWGDPMSYADGAVVSRDGALIAVRAPGDWDEEWNQSMNYVVLDPSGAIQRTFTMITSPDWQLDQMWWEGRVLIVHEYHYGDWVDREVRFDLDAGDGEPDIRPAPDNGEAYLAPDSPDNRWGVTRWCEDDGALCVRRVDGPDEHALNYGETYLHDVKHAAWSPDGQTIAVPRHNFDFMSPGPAVLAAVSTTTGEERVLWTAPAGATLTSLTWSPDSQWVYGVFDAEDDGDGERLFRLAAAGGEPQWLTELAEWNGYRMVSVGGPTPPVTDTDAPATPTVSVTTGGGGPGTAQLTVKPGTEPDRAAWIARIDEGTVAPASPTDGAPAAERFTGRTAEVGDLKADTAYAVAVFSTDWAGNASPAATATFTTRKATKLVLSKPAVARAGSVVTLTARLIDSSGAPVVGRQVRFSHGGAGLTVKGVKFFGTATTSATGWASLRLHGAGHPASGGPLRR